MTGLTAYGLIDAAVDGPVGFPEGMASGVIEGRALGSARVRPCHGVHRNPHRPLALPGPLAIVVPWFFQMLIIANGWQGTDTLRDGLRLEALSAGLDPGATVVDQDAIRTGPKMEGWAPMNLEHVLRDIQPIAVARSRDASLLALSGRKVNSLAERAGSAAEEPMVCMTLRWRELDSKIQFRDDSPPPSAWAPSFGGER